MVQIIMKMGINVWHLGVIAQFLQGVVQAS
jgi:hypothetical protein